MLVSIIRKIVNSFGYDVTSTKRLEHMESVMRKRPMPEATMDAVELALAYFFEKGDAENAVLLQIGACDGVTGDPVNKYVSMEIMRSYLVEPIPSTFENLVNTYAGVKNVTCINCAVGEYDGKASIFSAKTCDNFQAASLSKAHAENHAADNEILEIEVDMLTYGSLLKKYEIDAVDFLQVDCEGYDDKIVMMVLESGCELPRMINFETLHLLPENYDILFSKLEENYLWIHDKWNTLAIRKDIPVFRKYTRE